MPRMHLLCLTSKDLLAAERPLYLNMGELRAMLGDAGLDHLACLQLSNARCINAVCSRLQRQAGWISEVDSRVAAPHVKLREWRLPAHEAV